MSLGDGVDIGPVTLYAETPNDSFRNWGRQMKSIQKILVIEAILFVAAGVITFFVGDVTVERYGTVLLLCGLVPMTIGVVSEAGARYRPMPYSYKPKASVAQQHAREKEELLAKTTFLQNSLVIGAVPVGVGLLLMWM